MKVQLRGKRFTVVGLPNGGVRFPYELLVEIERHLRHEHGVPEEHCEAMAVMKEAWMAGCDAACAENQRRA